MHTVGVLGVGDSSGAHSRLRDGVDCDGPSIVVVLQVVQPVIGDSVTDNEENTVGVEYSGDLRAHLGNVGRGTLTAEHGVHGGLSDHGVVGLVRKLQTARVVGTVVEGVLDQIISLQAETRPPPLPANVHLLPGKSRLLLVFITHLIDDNPANVNVRDTAVPVLVKILREAGVTTTRDKDVVLLFNVLGDKVANSRVPLVPVEGLGVLRVSLIPVSSLSVLRHCVLCLWLLTSKIRQAFLCWRSERGE